MTYIKNKKYLLVSIILIILILIDPNLKIIILPLLHAVNFFLLFFKKNKAEIIVVEGLIKLLENI